MNFSQVIENHIAELRDESARLLRRIQETLRIRRESEGQEDRQAEVKAKLAELHERTEGAALERITTEEIAVVARDTAALKMEDEILGRAVLARVKKLEALHREEGSFTRGILARITERIYSVAQVIVEQRRRELWAVVTGWGAGEAIPAHVAPGITTAANQCPRVQALAKLHQESQEEFQSGASTAASTREFIGRVIDALAVEKDIAEAAEAAATAAPEENPPQNTVPPDAVAATGPRRRAPLPSPGTIVPIPA